MSRRSLFRAAARCRGRRSDRAAQRRGRLVDIALLPADCNRGIGTGLLRGRSQRRRLPAGCSASTSSASIPRGGSTSGSGSGVLREHFVHQRLVADLSSPRLFAEALEGATRLNVAAYVLTEGYVHSGTRNSGNVPSVRLSTW